MRTVSLSERENLSALTRTLLIPGLSRAILRHPRIWICKVRSVSNFYQTQQASFVPIYTCIEMNNASLPFGLPDFTTGFQPKTFKSPPQTLEMPPKIIGHEDKSISPTNVKLNFGRKSPNLATLSALWMIYLCFLLDTRAISTMSFCTAK